MMKYQIYVYLMLNIHNQLLRCVCVCVCGKDTTTIIIINYAYFMKGSYDRIQHVVIVDVGLV